MNSSLAVRRAATLIGVFITMACFVSRGHAAAARTSATPSDPGWPRQYSDGSAKLLVFQPQIGQWTDFRHIEGRFAIALTTPKGGRTVYGTLRVEAETMVDKAARIVSIPKFTIQEVSFPGVQDEAEGKHLSAITSKLFPNGPTIVALDRVLAYMEASQVKARRTAVSLDPPPILVSTQPAILVMIDGEPIFFDIEDTSLRRVLNTNWELFFDTKSSRFYLRYNNAWLSAKTLKDAWNDQRKLPKEFSKLPANEKYQETKAALTFPQNLSTVPLVLVSFKPTELILLKGAPSLEPIPGTQLSWVTNTESDLFFNSADRNYYFLTSGRWFRAIELNGNQWSAATNTLPEDFRKIAPDHPRAHVLASVPGTKQAEDAVLATSVPQMATIDRKTATAKVQYVGEPQFEAISGTDISFSRNTPNDVFKIGDTYYLCLEGVWFSSTSANGPWSPADAVPDEIYSIPPESPKHNVTYVNVYESTPDTITYGYTAGYTGVYVDYGVAMWGTGYYYPPYYGWGYYPYPVYWPSGYYTYGASVWYNPATGAYARGSAVYGPYGGYGRGAAYNPATGRYTWGKAAWGPYGAAATGGFYNPNTGAWGGGYRASNGYQSWGQSVVRRGDQWARTGSVSGSRGTVGGIQTSSGGKALVGRGSQGQGFVARSGAGDVYAGRDGNVYKRDQATGAWYRNNGGSWEGVNRPGNVELNSADRGQLSNVARTRGEGAGSGSGMQPAQSLNRDAAARSLGNSNTQRSSTSRGSSFGWGSRGGGGFAARGGGRRR